MNLKNRKLESLSVVGLVMAMVISGCKDKNAVQEYQVEKSEPSQPLAGSGSAAGPAKTVEAENTSPGLNPTEIKEKGPSGWVAQPLSPMRQASYQVKGEGGAVADVSLILLAGPAGGVLENVNRWLGQLGKPPVDEKGLERLMEKVQAEIGEVAVVDLEGLQQGADASKDGRILAGLLCTDGGSYFFKMRGNAALVASQKGAFVEWIRSVKKGSSPAATDGQLAGAIVPESPVCPVGAPTPGGGSAPAAPKKPSGGECPAGNIPKAPASDAAATGESVQPPAMEKLPVSWEVPEVWKQVPASAMRVASYSFTAEDGSTADISVSTLGSNGGGDLENVNRWRGQIGLPPATAEDLKSMIVPVKTKTGEIQMVDMAGDPNRILVAWAHHSGQTWFFKLTGPATATGKAKSDFIQFVQSIQFQQ